MAHRISKIGKQLQKSRNGYTLVEAIIAIAVCGFGLAMILGLYGMAIKTEMVSKTIYEQSLEINSITDEINLSLMDGTARSLSEHVDFILKSNYPDYQLQEIKQETQTNLYQLKILHKGLNSRDKEFDIKIFWRQDETPDT
ncbi:MAG: prepilin-type N-terminal cleavage/methylation domain-containing protein [Acetobacterium sp.]|nr:prepilin-type N-terminal cleavage/methylation domain-containing protein [uncultured Acetobacterium sp.]MBU4440283.1 prepilin-type N-terminal cleavage/methylation domain-containing protein [Bacillota bacterium]MCG2729248.1 prepilin-type N-terminal cleavage/methylation domain-containing protein [Acetobacterium sp.]